MDSQPADVWRRDIILNTAIDITLVDTFRPSGMENKRRSAKHRQASEAPYLGRHGRILGAQSKQSNKRGRAASGLGRQAKRASAYVERYGGHCRDVMLVGWSVGRSVGLAGKGLKNSFIDTKESRERAKKRAFLIYLLAEVLPESANIWNRMELVAIFWVANTNFVTTKRQDNGNAIWEIIPIYFCEVRGPGEWLWSD